LILNLNISMVIKNKQSKFWEKESFKYSISKKNKFQNWKLKYGSRFFNKILKLTKPKSIMEIGSNIGLNIHYIRNLDKKNQIKIDALEINKNVCKILKSKKKLKINKVHNKDILKFNDKLKYDLVFTVGVLIHIGPSNLNKVISKMINLSKKYILIVEYFSHNPEVIRKYRKGNDLLFKRDFGKIFSKKKNLKCLEYGFLWQEEEKIFDNLNWWIFEKK